MKHARIILAAILLLAATSAYAGTVFYVNGASGNDSGLGTAAAPWRTIQKAANTMISGDMVVVAAGSYPERVVITRSGNVNALISYTASGVVECRGFTVRADYILIKGFKVTAPQAVWSDLGYGIWVEGKFCRIEGNHAYYSPRGGINLRPTSAGCVVRDNRCQRNGMTGLEIHGSGNLVENNEIWGSIAYHTPTGAVGDADGIRFFGSGHTFSGNYIHDISYQDPENAGRDPHIDGFQTWQDSSHAAASNIVLERNRIILPVYKTAAANGHGFMLHNCSYITLRNNLVVTHGGTNTNGTATGGATHHLTIVGNTFAGSLSFPRSYSPVGISLQNCSNSVVRNNIVYDQADTAIYLEGSTLTGLGISNNCVYNSNGTTPGGTRQAYDIWNQNPMFKSPGSLDFRLNSGSPCIDAGMAIAGLSDDLDSLPRPSGNAYDIGACEYQAAAAGDAPSIVAQPSSLTIRSGQTSSLSVTAQGAATLAYQWYRGSSGDTASPVSGAVSSGFTTPALTQNANYWVRVSNEYGQRDSATAVITVTSDAVLPSVTTTSASAVTATGATAGGAVSSDGGATVMERGICWGTAANPAISGSRTSNGSGTGGFTSVLSGLSQNTTYHVRAYATNSTGTAYGNDVSFTTSQSASLPAVTTTSVSSISATNARSGGAVSSDGGTAVTGRGICWGTAANPTTSGSRTSDGSGTGAYTSVLSGLSQNTTYYVRAYATNASGTVYGANVSFTTTRSTSLPSVTTAPMSSITATGATAGGTVTSDGGAGVTERGICWGLTVNPTTSGSRTSDGSGTGAYTSVLSGLSQNTTYYVRAYATNASGTVYGANVSFITSASTSGSVRKPWWRKFLPAEQKNSRSN